MWRTSLGQVPSRAVAVRVALPFCPIDQLVDQGTVNALVPGSSPGGTAKFAISAVKVPFV